MYPTIINLNFFEQPIKMLKYFNSLELSPPTPKDNWPGLRSKNLCQINQKLHISIITKILKMYYNEDLLYEKINIKKSSIFFHKIRYEDWKNHNKIYTRIHKDDCSLASIIYLNEDINDENTGTSIFDENKKPILKISNTFNTIACYDGNIYHGATGLNKLERNTLVIFLNIE